MRQTVSTMPITRRLVAALTAALMLAAAGCARPHGEPEEQPSYSGPAEQLITVTADSPTATTATLTAWNRTDSHWSRAIGPLRADIGAEGVGPASESATRSPAGIWSLTEAFGIAANNGTRLPYRRVTESDWWVSDAKSQYYNTFHTCAPGTCPFDESAGEDLGLAGPAYDHAVVIDYNRSPVVPGAGSAYFLHVGDGHPTAGCVALPSSDLDAVMRWLDPTRGPVIDISVRNTPATS
ncbi:L,D-transpeptidase family protein [Nocardia sp. CDC153]|uniref:L,D-transpeptidase family protein n=1 Tax=Nocardia sp. CDC153 TaxID=3112167 RepID=UPI002DB73336|nr:L,D-transpeptidase family protein [Nocardia sp. CDC153]MEC3957420.1 L,D-transpeptidase family protein [Nocardia sp. CDC153]